MEKIRLASIDEVNEGEFLKCNAAGKKMLLTRVKGQIAAIENKCPHLGLPLAKGEICDGAVTCPFHGSSFDLLTGQNIDWTKNFFGLSVPGWAQKAIALGKAPQPVATFPVECEGDAVYLRNVE